MMNSDKVDFDRITYLIQQGQEQTALDNVLSLSLSDQFIVAIRLTEQMSKLNTSLLKTLVKETDNELIRHLVDIHRASQLALDEVGNQKTENKRFSDLLNRCLQIAQELNKLRTFEYTSSNLDQIRADLLEFAKHLDAAYGTANISSSNIVDQVIDLLSTLITKIEEEIIQIDTDLLLRQFNVYYDMLEFDDRTYPIARFVALQIAQIEGQLGYFKLLGEELTTQNMVDVFAPYMNALSEIQRILNEIEGEKFTDPVINLTKSGSLLAQVTEKLTGAIQIVGNYAPRRRRAEAEQIEITNEKLQLENELFEKHGDTKESLEIRSRLLEIERQEWELKKDQIRFYMELASEILQQDYPNLPPQDRLKYQIALARQLQITQESSVTPKLGWRDPPPRPSSLPR